MTTRNMAHFPSGKQGDLGPPGTKVIHSPIQSTNLCAYIRTYICTYFLHISFPMNICGATMSTISNRYVVQDNRTPQPHPAKTFAFFLISFFQGGQGPEGPPGKKSYISTAYALHILPSYMYTVNIIYECVTHIFS